MVLPGCWVALLRASAWRRCLLCWPAPGTPRRSLRPWNSAAAEEAAEQPVESVSDVHMADVAPQELNREGRPAVAAFNRRWRPRCVRDVTIALDKLSVCELLCHCHALKSGCGLFRSSVRRPRLNKWRTNAIAVRMTAHSATSVSSRLEDHTASLPTVAHHPKYTDALSLNLAPFRFSHQRFSAGRTPFRDEEQYRSLRESHRTTHTFRFDARDSAIYDIPMTEGAKEIGSSTELRTNEHRFLLGKAVNHALLAWLAPRRTILRRTRPLQCWVCIR